MESSTEENPKSEDRKFDFSNLINDYSKYFAFFTGMAFVIGYIIVNTFTPNIVVNFSLINVKYIVAGILFIVLVGIPILLSYLYYKEFEKDKHQLSLLRFVFNNKLIHDFGKIEKIIQYVEKKVSDVGTDNLPFTKVVLPLIIVVYNFLLFIISNYKITFEYLLILGGLTIGLILLYISSYYLNKKNFDVLSSITRNLYVVTLIFFIPSSLKIFNIWIVLIFIFIFIFLRIDLFLRKNLFSYSVIVVSLIINITFFGNFIYPNIKSTYGGGAPIGVTITFNIKNIENSQFKELIDTTKEYESKKLNLYDHSNGYLLVKCDSNFFHIKDEYISKVRIKANEWIH